MCGLAQADRFLIVSKAATLASPSEDSWEFQIGSYLMFQLPCHTEERGLRPVVADEHPSWPLTVEKRERCLSFEGPHMSEEPLQGAHGFASSLSPGLFCAFHCLDFRVPGLYGSDPGHWQCHLGTRGWDALPGVPALGRGGGQCLLLWLPLLLVLYHHSQHRCAHFTLCQVCAFSALGARSLSRGPRWFLVTSPGT